MKEVTLLNNDVCFSPKKKFNMLITSKMFDKLEAIVGEKHVRLIIAEIIQICLPILEKVLKSVDKWLLFQHLFEDIEAESQKMIKAGEIIKTKHHQILIFIQRDQYDILKQYHLKLNTFSMAMIIRIMVEVFLVLYKKYGNKDEVFAKLKKEIKNMLVYITNNMIKIRII